MKLGKRFGGRASRTWADVVRQYGEIIPPYPGQSLLKPSKLPDFPQVPNDGNEPEQALMLARCYRETMLAHSQSTIVPYFKGASLPKLLSDRFYPDLVRAIPIMIELQISPVAWTVFSFEVYRRYVYKKMAVKYRRARWPNPAWVFGVERLRNRWGWFIWHSKFLPGRTVPFCVAHRTLLEKWERVRLQLLAAPKLDRGVVQRIVDASLDDMTFLDLVRRAKMHYKKRTERLREAVDRGEWVW